MNISRELIECYFNRKDEKVDPTLPLFNKLEEVINDHIEFEVAFYGNMPLFIILEDNISLLIIVKDEEIGFKDTEFEVEFKVDFFGNITWFEISNMKGLSQEYNIG